MSVPALVAVDAVTNRRAQMLVVCQQSFVNGLLSTIDC